VPFKLADLAEDGLADGLDQRAGAAADFEVVRRRRALERGQRPPAEVAEPLRGHLAHGEVAIAELPHEAAQDLFIDFLLRRGSGAVRRLGVAAGRREEQQKQHARSGVGRETTHRHLEVNNRVAQQAR
jgi:hypothetical protein